MPKPGAPPLDMADTEGKSRLQCFAYDVFYLLMHHLPSTEQLTRKPKPFKVNITPRSDAILKVIQQTAKESHTDIPDIDSIKMDE